MIAVDWVQREPPLAPRYVVGRGPVAIALAARVVARARPVRGLVGPQLLIVEEESLPWVDGAVYVGCDPVAPSLFFDTRLRPLQPVDLIAAAVRRRVAGPALWLTDPDTLVPLGAIDGLHLPRLVDWMSRA